VTTLWSMASRWLRLLLVLAALGGGAPGVARADYAEVAAAFVTAVAPAPPRTRAPISQRRARTHVVATRTARRPVLSSPLRRSPRYLWFRALLL
jgi:hypothetical protein